jgi:hypothetical protein
MIVGVGRFGAHYPRVLAELSAEGGFDIERLVITRTRSSTARQTAAAIDRMPGTPFGSVEGLEVPNQAALRHALKQYRPALICITARDPRLGDSIHAQYVPAALDHGAVLCEKPFSRADDRAACALLQRLMTHRRAAAFSLHLPMAVVRGAMLAHKQLGARLRSARRIEFIWEKRGGSSDLIADLALHPWSLIPEWKDLGVSGIKKDGAQVVIDFETPYRSGRMILGGGGSFRGMRLDDLLLRFEFSEGSLRIMECTGGGADILRPGVCESESSLLSVENPLKQHIRALLAGRPVVNLLTTFHAQQFLTRAGAFT